MPHQQVTISVLCSSERFAKKPVRPSIPVYIISKEQRLSNDIEAALICLTFGSHLLELSPGEFLVETNLFRKDVEMEHREQTFLMVKPDGVQRGLVGNVISRLENKGLKLVGMKLMCISPELAAHHYGEHKGKPFYDGLIQFITSAPVVAMVLEGDDAVDIVRALIGATDPRKAAPGTIRGDLALFMGKNIVHGSDSLESAEREIDLFFDHAELCKYQIAAEDCLYD